MNSLFQRRFFLPSPSFDLKVPNNEEDTVEGLCVIKVMNNRFEMSEFF